VNKSSKTMILHKPNYSFSYNKYQGLGCVFQ
jgi:hypothetical protein